MLSQVWYNWVIVTSMKNRHLILSYSQITYLFLIIHVLPHNMNQNFDDSSSQSSGSVHIKKIEIPKDVSDLLESWLNKAKEFGYVRNNITIVEPSGGTPGTKKIMITNLNHEKIRKIEVVLEELMETSNSESNEDWDNFMCSIRHED